MSLTIKIPEDWPSPDVLASQKAMIAKVSKSYLKQSTAVYCNQMGRLNQRMIRGHVKEIVARIEQAQA